MAESRLHWGDILVIVGYFISVIAVGIIVSENKRSFSFKEIEMLLVGENHLLGVVCSNVLYFISQLSSSVIKLGNFLKKSQNVLWILKKISAFT